MRSSGLEGDDTISLAQLLLSELTRVGSGQLASDVRSTEGANLLGVATQSVEGLDDLAHILGLEKIDSHEQVRIRYTNRLAGNKEGVDVLHLDEGHAPVVDLLHGSSLNLVGQARSDT